MSGEICNLIAGPGHSVHSGVYISWFIKKMERLTKMIFSLQHENTEINYSVRRMSFKQKKKPFKRGAWPILQV